MKINSTKRLIFLMNRSILKMGSKLKWCKKNVFESVTANEGRPELRAALVRCRVGYFTYLSSQPKNSRFQTSEFWGLKT